MVLCKNAGPCFLPANPNIVRLLANIPLLQEEAAAVSTTKLIIPAAKGIPTNPNILTYGLSAGFNCCHGTTDMITANDPI